MYGFLFKDITILGNSMLTLCSKDVTSKICKKARVVITHCANVVSVSSVSNLRHLSQFGERNSKAISEFENFTRSRKVIGNGDTRRMRN